MLEYYYLCTDHVPMWLMISVIPSITTGLWLGFFTLRIPSRITCCMTLTFFKTTEFGLFWCFPWLDSGCALLAGIPQKWWRVLLGASYQEAYDIYLSHYWWCKNTHIFLNHAPCLPWNMSPQLPRKLPKGGVDPIPVHTLHPVWHRLSTRPGLCSPALLSRLWPSPSWWFCHGHSV